MKIDRNIMDEVEHFPCLVPAVASVMPFMDLFRDEGEIACDDEEGVCYTVECDLPLPDEDGSVPGMHWAAGIYEDRVEVCRLQTQQGVTKIRDIETLSLREFWRLLRQVSQGRTVPMTAASVGSGSSK